MNLLNNEDRNSSSKNNRVRGNLKCDCEIDQNMQKWNQ